MPVKIAIEQQQGRDKACNNKELMMLEEIKAVHSAQANESPEANEFAQSGKALEPVAAVKSLSAMQDSVPVPGSAQTYHAKVYAKDAERFGVAGPLGGYWVTVAASCLLQPVVGDQVLVSMAGHDGYILAVLVQADASHSELRVSGNTQLSAAQGSLTVAARDGLKLAGGSALMLDARTIRLTADTTGLTAQNLSIHARTMQLVGDTQHSVWREKHDVAHTRSSVATRLECRVQDRMTRVSGHDDFAAGSQRIVVQGDWRVRARNADVRARERASIDAEHVQLG